MLRLKDSGGDRFEIEPSDSISQGGEGTVYHVRQAPTLVAKIYLPPRDHARALLVTSARLAKLETMLGDPPRDHANPGHVAIAWPTRLLFDVNPPKFRGFLMRRVPKASPLAAYTAPSSRPDELRHLGSRHAHFAASNLALIFHMLHRAGHVVGDVSSGNVLAATSGLVSVVDTDSFQVSNRKTGQIFRCPVGTADFTPPELQGANFREIDRRHEHDLFGLAVLLFQLLMSGEHPFDGATDREDHGAWDRGERIRRRTNFPFGPEHTPFRKRPAAPPLSSLDQELQTLFVRCFSEGMHHLAKRPDAATWHAALIRATARLRDCSTNRVHAYASNLSACPHCEVERQVRKRVEERLGKRKTLPSTWSVPRPKNPGGPATWPIGAPWPSPPGKTAPFPFPFPPPPPPAAPLIGPGVWQIVLIGSDPRASIVAGLAVMSAAVRPCKTCRHFQRFRPITQLLARDVGIMEPALASELTRLMQDERQKQDAEAEQRLELLRIERVEWPDRPAMSDYCALREAENVFLMYEVKNLDNDCADHDPSRPARHDCRTCVSYVPQQGEAKAHVMLARYRELHNLASASGEPGDHGMTAYIDSLGSRQAFEAAQAYYFGRFSVAQPDHLPICRHFSTARNFVPCAIANRRDCCAAWRPLAAAEPHAGLFAEAAAAGRPAR